MAPFGHPFASSASPILTMTPHPVHQVPAGLRPFSHQAATAPTCQPSQHQQFARGRKRSRDEAAVNLDGNTPLPEIAIKPVKPSNHFGNGLVLPLSYVASSSPATANHSVPSQRQHEQDRPMLRSHKSQRLDQETLRQRDKSGPSSTRAASSPGSSGLPGADATTLSDAPGQPVVDDFTVHLGIGWRRISRDGDIQAAARGWARYIEKHYPISSAKILLESRGLESYLVEATEGFFLFAENLKQGRLVSRTVEGALQNLKTMPPIFEGGKEMTVGEVSPATVSPTPTVSSATGPVLGHGDVEMGI